jgi:hypothetical protein
VSRETGIQTQHVPRLNRYYKRLKIAEWKFHITIHYFVLDLICIAVVQMNKFSAASLSRAARRLRGRGIDPTLDQRERRSLWTPIFLNRRPRSKLTGEFKIEP